MTISATAPVSPAAAAANLIQQVSGQKISTCFQCQKCSNGCPVTFAMDVLPHRVIHLLQLGQLDPLLKSDTIWVCASCNTCSTRCPNDIDIAHVMDSLRQLNRKQGVKTSQEAFPILYSSFLNSVKKNGRVFETGLAISFTMKTGGLMGPLKYASTGLNMFKRGKIRLMPSRIRGIAQINKIFNAGRKA